MSDALREAQARIKQFERLGGIDLSRLSQEEQHPLLAEVRSGLAEYKKAIFTFRCSMCGKIERNNQDMEPGCTGPFHTDDHPLEPMVRVP